MKFTGPITAAVAILGGIGGVESKGMKGAATIDKADMDKLVEAFCSTAQAISDAFWDNGGKHHTEDDAYPQAACEKAHEVARGALESAYNYPDPVLFKPTLTMRPHTFRSTLEGALSYFIGTECLLKTSNLQYPPGNTGEFKEYGFGLANYGTSEYGNYQGFSGCKWIPDNYITGETVAVAQGQVEFARKEGGASIVDKTFSFGISANHPVITGHHSSGFVGDPNQSTQYVFPGAQPEPVKCINGYPLCPGKSEDERCVPDFGDCNRSDRCDCESAKTLCIYGQNICGKYAQSE